MGLSVCSGFRGGPEVPKRNECAALTIIRSLFPRFCLEAARSRLGPGS